MPLMRSSIDWTWPKKDWELKAMSIILPNIKCKEKREWKKNRLSNNFGTISKGITFGIPEEKKEQRRNT